MSNLNNLQLSVCVYILFVAAEIGNVEFLTIFVQSYPDIIWKVDENSRSIFHIAVMNRHEEIFKIIHELGAIKLRSHSKLHRIQY